MPFDPCATRCSFLPREVLWHSCNNECESIGGVREATVVSLMIGLKGRSRSVGLGAVWGFLIRRFTRLMIFRGASGALHFYRPRGAKQI